MIVRGRTSFGKRPALGIRRSGLIALLVLLPVAISAMSLGAAADREVRDLGTLPGDTTSVAEGINDAGQVVGSSGSGFLDFSAVLWQDGRIIDLGALPGDVYSIAFGINERGEVVGYSADANFVFNAFLWKDGNMSELTRLPGDTHSAASGINEAGEIAGGSGSASSPRAVLWDNGTPMDLGTLPGDNISLAYGLNDKGQVVGASGTPSGRIAGFLWEDGTMTELKPLPGDPYAIAGRINNLGQAVGASYGTNFSSARAVLWENGTPTDLGALPGDAYSFAGDINDLGQVVGSSGGPFGSRAVLWENGTITDLGTLPGHTYSSASGINGVGQIVGSSTPSSGETHAVLWAPAPPATHDVAVAGAAAGPRYAPVGTPVTIEATVENQGTVAETFDVTAFAGSTPVGTVTMTSLSPGGSAPVSFTWENPGPGSYAIRVHAVPVSGETDSADNDYAAGTVTVYAPLRVEASSPSETDVGLSITLTCSAQGGVEPYNYTWDLGGGTTAYGRNVPHVYDSAGPKTATCTVRDGIPTEDGIRNEQSAETTVVVHPAPSVTAHVTRRQASPGTPLTFTASVDGGSGGFTFAWAFGDDGVSADASPTHTYRDPGEYTATVTVRDSVDGTATDTLVVRIAYLTVTAEASDASVRSGQETVTFTATAEGGDGGPYTYTWEFGDGATERGQTVVHVYGNAGTYSAKVTVEDSSGNRNVTLLDPITVEGTVVSPFGDLAISLTITAVMVVAAVVAAALSLARQKRAKP